MLRPLLLASVFALAAPAVAQEVIDDMAPPVTEGIAAPDAQDQTDPNLPPGTVPTGIDEDTTDETVDHSTMGHSTTATGSTSVTADTTGTTGTMTTATTGATADVAAETAPSTDMTADTGLSTPTTSGAFTGMGGPIDIQSQWESFDKIGDGLLSPLEFAGWMAESMGRPIDAEDQAVELLNESADELALVDTNGDWHVSQAELTAASPQ